MFSLKDKEQKTKKETGKTRSLFYRFLLCWKNYLYIAL